MNHDAIARLRHGLVPAVPVPFTGDEIDEKSQRRYTDWMSQRSIVGVAVWAHTGRGLYLDHVDRERIFSSWREAMPTKLIIAGTGGSPKAHSDLEYIATAHEMAAHAKSLGADALLCYAPVRFRDRSENERDALILEYHLAIASAGLPLILFYLYEAAGGISYTRGVLQQLLLMDQVIGIKVATLDSIMTFQEISRLCKSAAPDKLVITGEDRFLGYSLMCGADAALIGMAATFTDVQARFIASFYANDLSTFHGLNLIVDAVAQATFINPMEGYIARISYLLARQSLFSMDSWRDKWGPRVEQHELDSLDGLMKQLSV